MMQRLATAREVRMRRSSGIPVFGLICLVLVAPGLLDAAATAAPAGEDGALYPRKLADLKATLQSLSPQRDGRNPNDAFLARLKQFRYLCGVPYEDLQIEGEYSMLANKASGICSKLNKLTHTPEKPAGMSDEEYKLGKKGAGTCNLFMGITHPVACVDGWMDDSDPHNIDRVGHRRWCLNPKMLKSGFGTDGKFAAMYAMDGARKSVPEWDFIAYPARGYMPTGFFSGHHAWSVLPNMAKYGKMVKGDVKVSVQPVDAKMAAQGDPLKLEYFNVDTQGFGCGPAIIFRPADLKMKDDSRYKVEITGLKAKNGHPATIRYLVHFVNMEKM